MNLFSTNENEGLAKNLSYAFLAQGAGFIASMLMSLVVPKILGVESYAYWQMFVLYSSYTGFTLLGINDGLYLRLGGERFKDLDKHALKAQFIIIAVFQVVVAVVCFVCLIISGMQGDRLLVFLFVAIFGLIQNGFSCLSYMFQSVNLTQVASFSSLINRVVFLPFLVAFVVFGIETWIPLVAAYLLCQTISFSYCLLCARDILKSSFGPLKAAAKDCLADFRSGIKVMSAYYSDTLIVGFTRMLTDWTLGLSAFGKLSFSFSLINFVLNFIGQFAMVAFPVLKRFDDEEKRGKYIEIRSLLHCLLPVVYLFYVPMCVVFSWWLPDYTESLSYLALVLPLCFYSCKANILFSTYLKMNRDESLLCIVNIASMILNAVLSVVAIGVYRSVEFASVGIIVSVFLRDCVFEHIMSRLFDIPIIKNCITEGLISAGFMIMSWYLSVWSFIPVVIMLVMYWHANQVVVRNLAKYIRSRFFKE